MSTQAGTNPFDVLLDREHQQKQVKNNSAKWAYHSAEVVSVGWGEQDIADCILFDSLFTERPTVHHGYSLDEGELMDGFYPRAVGFVRDWKLDPKGFYRGAWVSVVVDGYGVGGPFFGYVLVHSFGFTGTSIKPVREDITAASDMIPNEALEILDL
jgi:hypothetical protein